MNIRISLGMALAIMLMLGAVIFSVTRNYTAAEFTQKINDLRQREATQAKYAEIDRLVRDNYFDTIDETSLLDSVARGYIRGIGDEYASYIDARTYERLMLSEGDQLAGIGATIRATPEGTGYLVVEEVYPDSPAQAAGIEDGDLIVRIDEIDLTPENSQEMLEYISGEEGSRLTLTVRHDKEDTTVALTRRVVAVPTVYGSMLESDVGYLWIKDFDTNTSDQFSRELNRLVNAGARSLILDVRDNPGTRIATATRILDQILPAGTLYYEQGRDGTMTPMAYSADTTQIDLPMVVVVNENTQNAAEVFAQTLRDFDRARTVGVQSAGNGVVLDTIKLSDGSAIVITVAKLIPAGGEPLDGVGIKPDYDVASEADWQNVALNLQLDLQLRKAHEVALSQQRAVDPGTETESSAEEPLTEDSSQPAESSHAVGASGDESSQESSEEGDESSGEEQLSEDSESSGEESEVSAATE